MNERKEPGIVITKAMSQAFEKLPDDQCGKLLKILMDYRFNGVLPSDVPPEMTMFLSFIISLIDEQMKKYNETCEKNKKNIEDYWKSKIKKEQGF
ncbi:MAG: DUF6291 domain-containing protein [Paludibacteraceae bacterium]|nr:DUF6291 domain-containing protein [Paludibacteraceae bacterium]